MKFRPMTAATLAILEMVDSPFFTGGDSGIRSLLDYLLVHSTPLKEARKLAQDKEAFEDAAFEFGEKFGAEDLENLGNLVADQSDIIAKSVVEPSDEKK